MRGNNHLRYQQWLTKLYAVPYGVLAIVLLLACIGLALIYSAEQANLEGWVMKQGITIFLALPFAILLATIDINFWYRHAYKIYLGTILLLIIAEVVGHTAMGAQRWVRLGMFNLQPAEFAKIGVIIALSRYYHRLHSNNIGRIWALLPPLAMILVPSVLILKQPNLGSTIILIVIGASIMFAAGIKLWKFAAIAAAGLASLPVIWHFLHDYQKQRVMTFLSPEQDPLGSGYNILQSKIAIGSGGLFGKGFISGSQTQLNFLPEKQTDFIFTVLAEEFGLCGCLTVLLLYLILLVLSYRISWGLQNQFGRLVVFGVSAMLFIHILINIAMISGLIPVVGTPLPFLSYGRSNLVTMIIGYGFIANACVYKHKHIARAGR